MARAEIARYLIFAAEHRRSIARTFRSRRELLGWWNTYPHGHFYAHADAISHVRRLRRRATPLPA